MSSKVNTSVHDKLRSCIALGVLPANAELRLEVEYCTARRPSITLRGSSKKYQEYFYELQSHVRSNMDAWHVTAVAAPTKPRIGAFEITLLWTHNGYPYRVCVFSKLTTRLWPNVSTLVSGLAEVLPQQKDIMWFKIIGDVGEGEAICDCHIVIQDPDSDQVVRSAVTQPDGTAEVSVPEGMYNVTVQADGYTSEQALLTLMSTEPTVIRMSRAGKTLLTEGGSNNDSFN
eukprot:CAMPEP_0206213438 /NCGR_PEP_ID=MMETSP0047_2-20121206/1123_1 /ASSEMBLY_ACC=CAM_ASM_000192 /TAXON_ID=195065 /ORGANISM="Chroomonas mesostigmatica_cf, Strain CCMP1168" /LENGTH=229 /DNA_ID=CAMNT_0053635589 /DNA_START=3 /DNA_END=692 /DNA_ORIENTATION=+